MTVMLKTIGLAPLLAVVLMMNANPSSAGQTAVPKGGCKEWTKGGWVAAPCGGSGAPVGDGGAAARAAAAAAAAEQVRLGSVAASQGAAAMARGNFRLAANYYLAAISHQPDNVEYQKHRAAALAAFRQSGGDALDQVRAGDADEFDATGKKNTIFALPSVAAPTFSDTLFSALEIPVDLNDPANGEIKKVAAQMELKLNANLKAERAEQPPDTKGLEDTVAALNKLLETKVPKGTEPLTVEKVETIHKSYIIKGQP